MSSRNTVLIVGAGYTGLATAVYLIDQGFKVYLIEKSNYLGGLGKIVKLSNKKLCESFYHHYFINDKYLIEFLKRFINKTPTYKTGSMSIFSKNNYYSWNGLLDLIFFPKINFVSKIRFIISTIILSKGFLNKKMLDRTSLLKGMETLFGVESFKAIWEPILYGKFGSKVDVIPLRWMAGRLKQRIESRKFGEEKLGYMEGSIFRLTESIAKFIDKSNQSKIYKCSQIKKIIFNTKISKYKIEIKTRKDTIKTLENIDKLVFTTDQNVTKNILRENSIKGISSLKSQKHFTAYCVLMELNEPLSKYYWTNIADKSIFFCGYIEQTNLTGSNEYDGLYLGYLTKYVFLEKDEKPLSKYELKKIAFDSLKTLFPKKNINTIVKKMYISISNKAQLLTDFEFTKTNMDCLKKQKIFLGNMSNVYPDERSINNAIKVGYELSKKVIQ